MLKLVLEQPALDFLFRTNRKDVGLISLRIFALVSEPFPSGSIKLQDSEGAFRLRAGDYRIIYKVADDVVRILLVGPRHDDEVYTTFRKLYP